jgi:hypothetical protein
MSRVLSILLAAALAASAQAATKYRVTTTREGHQPSTSVAYVTVSGENVRIDFEHAPGTAKMYDRVVSRDGGATFIGINDDLHTWFPQGRLPLVAYSHYASYGMKPAAKKIQFSDGKLTYVTAGMGVRARHTIEYEIVPANGVARELWPGRGVFRTGLEAVDAEIDRSVMLQEFPQRIIVRVTRQLDGGPALTETVTMNVDEIAATDPAPAFFEHPAGYREQPPVIAAPGVVQR